MKGFKYSLLISIVMLLTYSCGSRSERGQGSPSDEQSTAESSAYTFEDFMEDAKTIPLSNTSISGIHQYLVIAQVDYFQELCNAPENVSRYLDSYPFAAANLGVYFADLIYHTYGRATENTSATIDSILQLADYLGMETGLEDGLLNRYQDQLYPADSTFLFWNSLMEESEKYTSESEKVFLKSALLLGNNIEKWFLVSSLIQTPFSREISPEDASLAKKELSYLLMNIEPRVSALINIFNAQKDMLDSVLLLEELEKLKSAANTLYNSGDKILLLDAAGIMKNAELGALHESLSAIRNGIVKE